MIPADKDNLNSYNIPVCNNCIHHIADDKCDAFENIPDEILNGQNDHSEPFPGDKGIRFEPTETAKLKQ